MILDFGFWILDWVSRRRDLPDSLPQMPQMKQIRRSVLRQHSSALSVQSVESCVVRNPKSKIQNPKFAFTLIETLIAIALLASLMSAMLAFGFDLLNSRGRALDMAWRQRAAATLIERLESDLAACVASDHGRTGLSGDDTHMSILTRGVAASLAERDSDDADVLGDLQLGEYQFDDVSGELHARRMPFGSADESEFPPLGGLMESVRFRYFDGVQWQSEFDSLAAGALPVAVEVAVWFSGEATSASEQPTVMVPGADSTRRAFDEHAFAMRDDRDASAAPAPDRVRVILLPHAAGAKP